MKYEGIKKGYPKIPGNRFRAYLQLIRPFTVVVAIIAGMFIYTTFALYSNSELNYIHMISTGIALGILQAGGQVLNQSTKEEVEIDKINGKTYRPTVSGVISIREGQIVSLTFFAIGAIISFLLNIQTGIVSLALIFFASTYTINPIRNKKRFGINNIHQATARGFLPPLFVGVMFGEYHFAMVYGIMVFFWITGFQTTKDFDDVEGDKKFGIKTLPVVWSNDAVLFFMGICTVFTFITLYLGILGDIFPNEFSFLTLLSIPSLYILSSIQNVSKLKRMENNKSWVAFYVTILLWYVLPAISLILS